MARRAGESQQLGPEQEDPSAGVDGCKVQEQGGPEGLVSTARSPVTQTVAYN